MAQIKVAVIVLAVQHQEEDRRIVEFSPLSAEGNVDLKQNFKVHVKGSKKGDNFEEGETYELTIAKAVEKQAPAVKTPPAGKGTTKPKTEAQKTIEALVDTRTPEEIQADLEADKAKIDPEGEIEANAKLAEEIKANAGKGEGQ
jgi:hypothetical protein